MEAFKRFLFLFLQIFIFFRCKANEIADKLCQAHVVYDKLKTSNEDDLEPMLKPVKLPKDIDRDWLSNMILDHFQPTEEVATEGVPEDEDIAEEQDLDDMYTLPEFFKEIEMGEHDSEKANRRIVEIKKLFVPMRKHFQVICQRINETNT